MKQRHYQAEKEWKSKLRNRIEEKWEREEKKRNGLGKTFWRLDEGEEGGLSSEEDEGRLPELLLLEKDPPLLRLVETIASSSLASTNDKHREREEKREMEKRVKRYWNDFTLIFVII